MLTTTARPKKSRAAPTAAPTTAPATARATAPAAAPAAAAPAAALMAPTGTSRPCNQKSTTPTTPNASTSRQHSRRSAMPAAVTGTSRQRKNRRTVTPATRENSVGGDSEGSPNLDLARTAGGRIGVLQLGQELQRVIQVTNTDVCDNIIFRNVWPEEDPQKLNARVLHQYRAAAQHLNQPEILHRLRTDQEWAEALLETVSACSNSI